jgi:hypothetical protein
MVTEGWIRLAEGLGWVSSKVILSVVFFCILLPIAMIRRLFKGDTLHLKKENLKTLFETRDHKYVPEDLENPF